MDLVTPVWAWRSDSPAFATRVRGREHIPTDRAVVFCSNHESNVDPPVLFQALHKRLHVFVQG
jgi:1-acyl-sn-glycerol-3-phosphate acyltransferase